MGTSVEMSSIPDWYSGKTILVTGGTGFMGKILIEKLLRSCPGIKKIYVLIRHKRGKTPKQRMDDLFNTPIFQQIKENAENPDMFFEKLEWICGDITQNQLGLAPNDLLKLKENVQIVFHMAANVRFDQPLKQAVTFNTGGTLKVLDLAENFEKLEGFVHVGTSYCHCDQTVLEEQMYNAPHNPRKILDLLSWLDESLIKLLEPHLLKNFPNTYAYSKCLTEELIKEYTNKMHIAIARPSMVISSLKEPIPGWIDNLNGPTGIIVGGGKGVIRSMHGNPNLDADVVPVDIVINRLIVLAKELCQAKLIGEPLVYNLTCDPENPISWGRALEIGKKHCYNYPFSILLWYPGGSLRTNYFIHILSVIFFHWMPAYLIDGLFTLFGKKPFLVNTQKRIQTGLDVLQYYTMKEWKFKCDKMKKLAAKLDEKDRITFNTDMSELNWDKYVLDYMLGARKYCLKEDPSTIPKARILLKRMYYLHIAANAAAILLVLWLCQRYYETVVYAVITVFTYIFQL